MPRQLNGKKINVRHDTILEENIGKIFYDVNHSSSFLGLSPKAIEIKAKIGKWYLIKLKSFCTANKIINKIKKKKKTCGLGKKYLQMMQPARA